MGICLISASGTMGIVLHDRISKIKNIEIETLISIGNLAGLKYHDYINWAAKNDNINCILIYMEDVKPNFGRQFMDSCLSCKTPIVILKGGRSLAGGLAALSHTGALAGSDKIYQAAFNQCGVILVDIIEELFIAAEVFSMCKIPKGNRVAILSPGGGANISCVDFCQGLEIPEFSDKLQENINRYLPKHAPLPVNPIDMAASFDFYSYHNIVYDITISNEVDLFITNFVMTDGYINEWNKKLIPNRTYNNSPIPIIGSWMGEEGKSKAKFEKFIPVFNEPAIAAWAARLLIKQMKYLEMKNV